VNRVIRPEFNPSFSKRKQGIVFRPGNKKTGLEARSPLPDENLTGLDPLAPEGLHTQSLGV